MRRAFGLGSKGDRVDFGRLLLPNSPACREAERLCARVPAVVNHSFRTYLWAALLGQRDGIDHDAEALYVAALVHAIGFAAAQRTADGRPCCLTVPGARAAIEIGATAGWDNRRSEMAAEAITLHANVYVGRRHGPEAYLLYAGARLDQTGFRYGDLHPDDVDAVLTQYPRQGWKTTCCHLMRQQTDGAPGTRVAFYTRKLAGNRFIMHAPFED